MAVISVEIPDELAIKFKPFTIVKIETLFSMGDELDLSFDFRKEKINQDDFLSYLKAKHG